MKFKFLVFCVCCVYLSCNMTKMKMLRQQWEYVGKKEAGLQPAGVQDKEIQYHPLCSSRI